MAAYVVLARKWRPAQFSDIVGQGPIVRTLMNAIKSSRIHHAYLLTGSRGIGKTSIARIFAKAVRCEAASTDEATGLLKSCDQCSSCKEIAAGNCVDVIEIDGASNNGVDAVREIRENARFLPASGSRKIYIIDEVHMLTTAAFNALLKTLEEPPAHVIFIFATTEPHKIPATILSRCQRFDLRRVTMVQIQSRLQEVTRAEGIEAESGALALLARAAEGGMRDAMSLLDQVISFSGTQITAQAVRESVGLIEGQTLLGVLSGILSRKPLEALKLVDEAYRQGHDLRVLTRSLIEFLHGTILAKVGAQGSGLLELSEEEWKELQTLAELRPLEELEMIFQALHHGVEWIARSPQPKIVLDVLLVKCAAAEVLAYASETGSGGTTTSGTGHRSAASAAAPAPAPAPAPAIRPATQAQSPSQPPSSENGTAPATTLAPTFAPTASPAAAPAPSSPNTWEGLIAHVRKVRPLLASILEHSVCEHLPYATQGADADTLILTFRPEDAYFREQLQARAYSEQFVLLSKEYFGQRLVRVRIEQRSSGASSGETLVEKREREHNARETSARTKAQNHPIINEARALFGGELGPIVLTPQNSGDAHAGQQ